MRPWNHFALAAALSWVLISGCTGRSSTPNYITNQEPSRQDALVVVGAEIGSGNLRSYLLALYVNHDLVGMQGPIREKSATFWTAHHHFEYEEVQGDGRVYLMWRIPHRAFAADGPNAMAYLACISNRTDNLFYWDGFTDLRVFSRPPYLGLFPLRGRWNPGYDSAASPHTHDEAPLTDFEACVFSIDRPAIYYLGEIEVRGTMTEKTDDRPFHIRRKHLKAELKTNVHSDKKRLEARLRTLRTSGTRMVDLSDGWKMHPISRYYALTRRPLGDG